MLVGEKVVDGKIVKTDASGAVTVSEIAADGWSRCDGEYYYYQNGKPYTGWVGAYYVSNGLMLRDTAVVDQSGNQYWVNEYGVYQTIPGLIMEVAMQRQMVHWQRMNG